MSRKIEIARSMTSLRLPATLMKRVKLRCLLEDKKFNDYVAGLIEKDMESWKAPDTSAMD